MYFIDALYGEIELDIPRDILSAPELQRLREIRLCNINSPFITGGTSLNRFEHAIGTAYLAQEIVKFHTEDKKDQVAFLIASLLHDIVTAPFGHSLEYLFESIKNETYEHANIWRMIFTGKTIPSSRSFFCGRKAVLHSLFPQETLERVHSILESSHTLSKLLVNEIDIDNIDNVFRFAFHIGITFDRQTPLKLAKSLRYSRGKLSVASESIDYYIEWFEVRKKLYKYLLEDEGEFVAKSLLERCFIECVKEDLISEYDWILTDAEMVQYILDKGNKTARNCMQRLMLMSFPKYREIYYVTDYKKLDTLLAKKKLEIIDMAFRNGVLLHFIRDVNKTNRRLMVTLQNDLNKKELFIGTKNDRYLIGLFSDNRNAITTTLSYLRKELKLYVINLMEKEIHESQISLF